MMEWTPTKQLFLYYAGDNKSHYKTIPSTCKPHMHGHGDDTYAHYAIDMWPKDLNFTILSLARCLCTLGKTSVCNSNKLFAKLLVNDHFEKLLCGKTTWGFFLIHEIHFLSHMSITKSIDALCWTQMLVTISNTTNCMDRSGGLSICKLHHHNFWYVYILAFKCRSSIPWAIDGADVVWSLLNIYIAW